MAASRDWTPPPPERPQFAVSNPLLAPPLQQYHHYQNHNQSQIRYGHVTQAQLSRDAAALPDRIDDVDSLVTDMSRLRVVAPSYNYSSGYQPQPPTYQSPICFEDELYQYYIRLRYLMELTGERLCFMNPNLNSNGFCYHNSVPYPRNNNFRVRNSARSGSRPRSRPIDYSWSENQRTGAELISMPIFSLQELSGNVCMVAKDPHLRSFLDEKISERDQAFIDLIFFEVKTKLFEMITNHSANHLIQNLLSVLNEDQISQFIYVIISHRQQQLLMICDDTSGTYVMQKLLEVPLTRGQMISLVSAFRNIAATMSKSQHAHHVIIHCIQRFPDDIKLDLFEAIVSHAVDLARNQSGCCVLQDCLEHVADCEQKRRLINVIVASALDLSDDRYGNYVVQNLLENKPEYAKDIIAQLRGNFYRLSMSRYASNVVEKCLKAANDAQSNSVMVELLSQPARMLDVVTDEFGNYVAQSIWIYSQKHPVLKNMFMNLMSQNMNFLTNHMFAKNVVATVFNKGRRR